MTGRELSPSLSPAAWSLPARERLGRNKSGQNGPAFVPQLRDYGLARAGKPAEKARH
jgi:hypothetical protein